MVTAPEAGTVIYGCPFRKKIWRIGIVLPLNEWPTNYRADGWGPEDWAFVLFPKEKKAPFDGKFYVNLTKYEKFIEGVYLPLEHTLFERQGDQLLILPVIANQYYQFKADHPHLYELPEPEVIVGLSDEVHLY